MKTRTSRALILGWLSLAGCGVTGPSTDEFIIRIDEIVVPPTAPADQPLTVHFTGPIGPDGCWSLAMVEKQVTSAGLEITFHGQHLTGTGTVCTQSPVALDHDEVVPPPRDTPFTITVHQPDGSLLTREVTAP